MNKLKHVGLSLSLALVSLVVLEISTCTALVLAKVYRPVYFEKSLSFYHDYLTAISDDYVRRFRSDAYDPLLGWNNKPNSRKIGTNAAGMSWVATYDQFGARTNPAFEDPGLIASYGDSYTHGDEVNGDETWQYYLSKKIRSNVQNFGVGGYGTDQALLKLEQNFRNGFLTPYVLLGIHEENINRIVNTFRPFYIPGAWIKLGFKPRFILQNGAPRLIQNAMPSFNTRADATRALNIASEDDYWFLLNKQKVEINFPFSLGALDLLFLVMQEKGIIRHPYKKLGNSQYSRPKLWDDPEAVRLMGAIIRKYVQLSSRFHFQPILVFFPHITRASDGSLAQPQYKSFVRELREQYLVRELTIIDLYEAEFDMDKFRVLSMAVQARWHGHFSPYGNRVISEFISSHLCTLNVIFCE